VTYRDAAEDLIFCVRAGVLRVVFGTGNAPGMSAEKLREEALALPLDERAALAKGSDRRRGRGRINGARSRRGWAEEIDRPRSSTWLGVAVSVELELGDGVALMA
jgi:hypothetical protein